MDSAERFLTWFGKKSRQPTAKGSAAEKGTSPAQILPKHYLMLNEIGSGGMGVLYKAIDTRLHRPVVVKAIRESLLQDPDLVHRFRKEALANAAIDHPYVCKIYELLETEGRTLIVMEYVEGENLEQILARGPLGISETLRFATEIAEALGAAHARGLVHRDIKPSNIIVTAHRHVKVIDFGLAKALQDGAEDRLGSRSGATQPEAFVGTLCYMSPEQASGEPIGRRSDVFSLGVLIFQCLTGRLPFHGDTSSDYIQNLLLEPPTLLRTLVPSVPGELEQLVGRCLAKDPTERPESADALAEALVRVADLISSGLGPALPLPARGRTRRRVAVSAAAMVLGAAGLFGLSRMGLQDGDRPADPGKFKTEALVTWPSEELESRISPDGKWISFVSNRDGLYNLWIQSAQGGEPFAITKAQGRVMSMVWSPDAMELAYLQINEERSSLNIIPVLGGSARLSVTLSAPAPELIRWLGEQIYFRSKDSLWRLGSQAGALQEVFRSKPDLSIRSIDVRRDSKRILYAATTRGSSHYDLWAADLDGGNLVQLTNDAFEERFPRWLDPEGRSIVFSSNKAGDVHLWRMFLDSGAQQQITFGSNSKEVVDDTTADGSVLTYVKTEESSNLHRFDPQTMAEVQLTADSLPDCWPSIASGTGAVAFQRSRPGPDSGNLFVKTRIFLGSGDSAEFQYARLQIEDGYGPLLSSDGRWLAYLKTSAEVATRPGAVFTPDLWLQDLQTQRPRPIGTRFELGGYYPFPLERISRNLAWSPDSQSLYSVHRAVGGTEIRRFQLQSGSWTSEVIVSGSQPQERFRDLMPSPDGRHLAYVTYSGAPDETFRVHLRELSSGKDLVLLEERMSEFGEIMGRGWLSPASLLLLRCRTSDDSLTSKADLLEIHADASEVRVLGVADRIYGGTARLDAKSGTLYVTGVEGQAHNLYAFSLSERQWRRLTRNEFPGVTFSGIDVSPQGAILYSRQTWNKNIWRLRIQD